MSEDRCPLCGADLHGALIPEEHRGNYGGHTHFSRRINLYSQERDMTVAFMCPDCKGTWDWA